MLQDSVPPDVVQVQLIFPSVPGVQARELISFPSQATVPDSGVHGPHGVIVRVWQVVACSPLESPRPGLQVSGVVPHSGWSGRQLGSFVVDVVIGY